MRRILPAILIAIFFHVSLFSLNPGLFTKTPGKIKKPAITVTMSYKKKPVAPPPVEKPPPKKRKKKEVVKKVKKPAPIKKNKPILEPEPEKKEEIIEEKLEVVEEDTVSDPVIVEVDNAEESATTLEEVVSVGIIEAEPLYRENPEPRYPRMARKRGHEGTVILSVLVSKDGKVTNLWVFESCGYKILDNAALKAVADWTFEPGRQGDDAVEMWVQVPVRFELK